MYRGQNYVNGEWKEHVPDFAKLDPTNEMDLGFFPITEGNAVAEAVDAAKCAFNSWRKISRVKRAEYFDNLAQLMKERHVNLTHVISEETGKTLNEASAEVNESRHMIEVVAGSGRQSSGEVYASEVGAKDIYVTRKPKGVVAVVSPWNFPLAIGSCWCAAPAILEGNCVVHKPSEYTPMTAQLGAWLYEEAGFPPGVFNLIHGMEHTGEQLVHDNGVDVVLFTGSAEVGRLIRQHCASTWHKTCSCEMGSKSAIIVFEDADIDLAIDACVGSAFKLSGQRCVSASRMIVQRTLVEEFTERFVERAKELKTGAPAKKFKNLKPILDKLITEEDNDYGPLINMDAVDKVEFYNKMVREDPDANVFLDGGRLNGDGYFFSPFVYGAEWDNRKRFLVEEVFGPHVAIIPFDETQDAIDIYNDTEYGLALGVITEDFRTMRICRDECDTGMLYINGGCIGAESFLPFGGVKKSGNGWKSAAGTYRAVTEEIVVTTNHERGVSWAQGMK
jgi:aldehyde dehydrogenase (NAD+)